MASRKLWLISLAALFAFTSRETDALLDILTLTPGVALGGIIVGIVASTLGGISIAIALEKVEFVDPPAMMEGYGNRRRGRRDADNLHEEIQVEKFRVEQFIDDVYQKDHSQCLEKLICDVTKRATVQGSVISPEEADILSVIEKNSNRGLTYKKMVMAQKVALGDGDCDFLFDSCPLKSDQMVEYIGQTVKQVTIGQTSVLTPQSELSTV